jgi:predicted ester cyclase
MASVRLLSSARRRLCPSRTTFNQFTTALPDIHVSIHELIAEGDKVVARWTMTGTHCGVWDGIPATGNAVKWDATDIFTVANGKIASLVRAADNLAWLRQLEATATCRTGSSNDERSSLPSIGGVSHK